MLGTQSIGMDNGGGWMMEAAQKIPWAGKRALRGSAALAEADAMRGDIGDVRLRLSEAARTAFYDYYLARREMDVNTSTAPPFQPARRKKTPASTAKSLRKGENHETPCDNIASLPSTPVNQKQRASIVGIVDRESFQVV